MNIFRTVLKDRFVEPGAGHPGSPHAIVLLGMIWKFVSNRHGEGTWTSGEGIGSWWCKLYGGIKNTHRNLCALCRFWGTQQKTVPHKLSQAVTRDWTCRCLDVRLNFLINRPVYLVNTVQADGGSSSPKSPSLPASLFPAFFCSTSLRELHKTHGLSDGQVGS